MGGFGVGVRLPLKAASHTNQAWPLIDDHSADSVYREAVFFLLTNTLIVFGLVAFDNALAILQLFPVLFPALPQLPSPALLVRALLAPTSSYDHTRIIGLQQALVRLRRKSRSFYLASSAFQGRLRIDLVLLYSFCRVADDLIDNAKDKTEAWHWIAQLKRYLDLSYATPTEKPVDRRAFIEKTFPADSQSTLLLLPTAYLPSSPLYDLLRGFETDTHFPDTLPIVTEADLKTYGERVAGTVAELCLHLVYHHASTPEAIPNDGSIEAERLTKSTKVACIVAGFRMGIALQYVNIARDIAVDANIGRVYLPKDWLQEESLPSTDIVPFIQSAPAVPDLDAKINRLRARLLDRAFEIYGEARGAIEELPNDVRAAMRVAVESYMEIGRVIKEEGEVGNGPKDKKGRATVPKGRRLRVAYKALSRG